MLLPLRIPAGEIRTDMRSRSYISALVAMLALSGASLVSAQSNQQPPSDAEIRERAAKLIANQHANDLAIEEYERIERHVDRTGGANPRILEDKTYRVVPTGPGTLKILLQEGDKPADAADIRKELQNWRDLLQLALNPKDPRIKAAYAKADKKKRDRAELVNAARDAYMLKWVGRENVSGRDCDVIQLEANPDFHPHSTFQEAFTHANAKIWVDRNAIQMVRAEAHIIRDLSFGGGILGKLYRGGVFHFEQTEVAPGVWLPSRYQFDYTARKFLFTFEEHQFIEVSHHRRVGPPKEALVIAQQELANAKPAAGDP